MIPAMSARERAEFLAGTVVFASLPENELASLASVARENKYRAREYIFMEGDAAIWFCLVRAGRVKIIKHSKGGRDVVLELLGPGEPFGGVAVIEQRPYPASAQATEPSVILKIPQDPIVALAERYPSVIKELAFLIGRRLRAAHASVKSLALDPADVRLAAALLKLAEREGTKGPRGLTLPFHLTRQSLADMAGTTVETTIRVVSRWLKNGVVLEDSNRLVLKDLQTLRALVEGEPE
jgi:CRP-like cAMP-binding protein